MHLLNEQAHLRNQGSVLSRFFLDNILEFWEGKRLRDMLLYSLFLGTILLFVAVSFGPKQLITIVPVFLGIILGIGCGMILKMHFLNNIKNNFYYFWENFFL